MSVFTYGRCPSELFENAVQENIIAFLPFGQDKSFISLRLIEHYHTLNQERVQNFQPRRVIAVLAPTKALIKNHKHFIASHSKVCVRTYTGECFKYCRHDSQSDSGKGGGGLGVDDEAQHSAEQKVNIMSWSGSMWREEADEVDVFLLSPVIFLHLLEQQHLSASDFSLVVFDECQHVVGRSPMAEVCPLLNASYVIPTIPSTAPSLELSSTKAINLPSVTPLYSSQSTYTPRIFGMLSTPLSCKKGSLVEKLRCLEKTLSARLFIESTTKLDTDTDREFEGRLRGRKGAVEYEVLRYSSQGREQGHEERQERQGLQKVHAVIPPSIKSQPSVVLTSPVRILQHASLRLVHASYLQDIYSLLWLHRDTCTASLMSPILSTQTICGVADEFMALLSTRFSSSQHTSPSDGISSSNSNSGSIPVNSLQLQKYQLLVDKIMVVWAESGVVCALIAFKAGITHANDELLEPKLENDNENDTSKSDSNAKGTKNVNCIQQMQGCANASCKNHPLNDQNHQNNSNSDSNEISSRVKHLRDELLSGCFLHTNSSFNTCHASLLKTNLTLSDPDWVAMCSVFDVFACLVAMLGSKLCQRSLAVMDRKLVHDRESSNRSGSGKKINSLTSCNEIDGGQKKIVDDEDDNAAKGLSSCNSTNWDAHEDEFSVKDSAELDDVGRDKDRDEGGSWYIYVRAVVEHVASAYTDTDTSGRRCFTGASPAADCAACIDKCDAADSAGIAGGFAGCSNSAGSGDGSNLLAITPGSIGGVLANISYFVQQQQQQQQQQLHNMDMKGLLKAMLYFCDYLLDNIKLEDIGVEFTGDCIVSSIESGGEKRKHENFDGNAEKVSIINNFAAATPNVNSSRHPSHEIDFKSYSCNQKGDINKQTNDNSALASNEVILLKRPKLCHNHIPGSNFFSTPSTVTHATEMETETESNTSDVKFKGTNTDTITSLSIDTDRISTTCTSEFEANTVSDEDNDSMTGDNIIFPLVTSKATVCLQSLLCHHSSSCGGGTEGAVSSIVFSTGTLTALSLYWLMQLVLNKLDQKLQSDFRFSPSTLDFSISQDHSLIQGLMKARLTCNSTILFTTDKVCGDDPLLLQQQEQQGTRFAHILYYDLPISLETFHRRNEYATIQNPATPTVSILVASNPEGDQYVNFFEQHLLQDAERNQYMSSLQHDQAVSTFLAAVSALHATGTTRAFGVNSFTSCSANAVKPLHVSASAPITGGVGGDVISKLIDTYWEQHPPQSKKKKRKEMEMNMDEGGSFHKNNKVIKGITEEGKQTDFEEKNVSTSQHAINTIIVKVVPECLVPSKAATVKTEKHSDCNTSHVRDGTCDEATPFYGAYQPVLTHFYAVCSVVCAPHTNHANVINSCPSCSTHLDAANSCGLAFLQPLSPSVLSEPMPFGLRGCNLAVTLTYLGAKVVNESEMLAMQTFHRSILCWETDGPLDYPGEACSLFPTGAGAEQYPTDVPLPFQRPLSPTQWAQSSGGAWYILFPLMHPPPPLPPRKHSEMEMDLDGTNLASKLDTNSFRCIVNEDVAKEIEFEKQKLFLSTDEWLLHLQACAAEAKMLVDNLYQHQYRTDKVVVDVPSTVIAATATATAMDNTPKYPLLYSHRQEDLVDQLFSRDKDYIYLGIKEESDIENGTEKHLSGTKKVTFDDVMLEGNAQNTGERSKGCDGDEKRPSADLTYLEYFVSKGRISLQEAAELRRKGDHGLIRAAGVQGRLSLIQINTYTSTITPKCNNNDNAPHSTTTVPSPHSHTSTTHLLPAQCKLLGRGKWFFCGLLFPSITWRLQSLLLAVEARDRILSKDVLCAASRHTKSLLARMQEYTSTTSAAANTTTTTTTSTITTTTTTTTTTATTTTTITSSSTKTTTCTADTFPKPITVKKPTSNTNSSKSIDNSSASGNESGVIVVPSASMMLTALTPRLALEVHDSERMEFLGDIVLKMSMTWAVYESNPQAQEGDLTIARTALISNSFLAQQARCNDLVQYLRALNFSTGKQELLFPPPGMRFHSQALHSITGRDSHYLRNLWNRNINAGVKQSVLLKSIQLQFELDALVATGTSSIPLHESKSRTATLSNSSDTSILKEKTKSKKNKKKKNNVDGDVTIPPSRQYITAQVKAKVLADMVEAIVGMCYLSGGIVLSLEVLRSLHIWPTSSLTATAAAFSDSTISSMTITTPASSAMTVSTTSDAAAQKNSLSKSNIDTLCTQSRISPSPRLQLPLPLFQQTAADEVGSIFKYTFKNPSLLVEALTCMSGGAEKEEWEGKDGPYNYQRLEFLGDGVLDLAIVDLLYHAMPSASQGQLTDLKCALTNNKRLGHLGTTLHLYKYLFTSSSSLAMCLADMVMNDERGNGTEGHLHGDVDVQMDECVETILANSVHFSGNGNIDRDNTFDDSAQASSHETGLKVLADVVEAIIGAVFLDSDCSLSTVQRVIRGVQVIPNGLLD